MLINCIYKCSQPSGSETNSNSGDGDDGASSQFSGLSFISDAEVKARGLRVDVTNLKKMMSQKGIPALKVSEFKHLLFT